MKTAMIARFVMGAAAIFAAAGLAGCGAETGQGPEDSIGVSSAALTTSSIGSMTTPRLFATSCELIDGSSNHYVLVAGGQNASGTPLKTSQLYDVTNTTWNTEESFSASASEGRINAQLIQVPGHTDWCLLAGGENGATKLGTAYLYKLGIGWTTAGSLTARSQFGLADCDGSIVAIGGNGTSGRLSSIEKWNGASTWSALSISLTDPRSEFGLASPASGKIFVSGGRGASTNLDTVEVIRGDGSCGANTKLAYFPTLVLNGGSTVAALDNAAKGPVAFVTANPGTTTFASAGGDDSGTALNKTNFITVTWNSGATLPSATKSTTNTSMHAVAHPALAINAANQAIIVGGDDAAGATVPFAQKYSAGWTSVAFASRYGIAATFVSGYGVVAAGGFDDSLMTPNEVANVELVSP